MSLLEDIVKKTDHAEGDADRPTAETLTSYTDMIRHLFLSGSATNDTYKWHIGFRCK